MMFNLCMQISLSCSDANNQVSGQCTQGDECACFGPSSNIECGCIPGYGIADVQGVSQCHGVFLYIVYHIIFLVMDYWMQILMNVYKIKLYLLRLIMPYCLGIANISSAPTKSC